MEDFVKRSVRITALIVIIAAIALIFSRRALWGAGLIVGAAWSVINFLLIVNILKVSVLEKPGSKLFAILLAKFPLLYLAGFFILNLKIFPIESLLTGLVSIFLGMGVLKLCQKRA